MADRRYTKTHEWVAVDGKHATIGITDFAQSQLGDVVFLELPSAGRPLSWELILALRQNGVAFARVTHSAGIGIFAGLNQKHSCARWKPVCFTSAIRSSRW